MAETPIVAPADPWDAVKAAQDTLDICVLGVGMGDRGQLHALAATVTLMVQAVDQARALAAAQHQQEIAKLTADHEAQLHDVAQAWDRENEQRVDLEETFTLEELAELKADFDAFVAKRKARDEAAQHADAAELALSQAQADLTALRQERDALHAALKALVSDWNNLAQRNEAIAGSDPTGMDRCVVLESCSAWLSSAMTSPQDVLAALSTTRKP